MALPTLDRQDCGAFPPDHSIEDHLEAERAALDADLRAAASAGAPGRDRWMLVRAAGLGLALAGTIAFGLGRLHDQESAPACPAATSTSADAATGAEGCR